MYPGEIDASTIRMSVIGHTTSKFDQPYCFVLAWEISEGGIHARGFFHPDGGKKLNITLQRSI